MNGIGAIGAYMGYSIYPNYVYNNNQVSSDSLNKIDPIPEDGTRGRVNYNKNDYSNDLNQNPLKPGETKDFNSILESQLAQSQRNAARFFGTFDPVEA